MNMVPSYLHKQPIMKVGKCAVKTLVILLSTTLWYQCETTLKLYRLSFCVIISDSLAKWRCLQLLVASVCANVRLSHALTLQSGSH